MNEEVEYKNVRFDDNRRIITYDMHYHIPLHGKAIARNCKTARLTNKEYFRRKLKGE